MKSKAIEVNQDGISGRAIQLLREAVDLAVFDAKADGQRLMKYGGVFANKETARYCDLLELQKELNGSGS
jgi:hypothetical protein